jgi:Co/Zn/Cd efflux system component
MRRVQFIVFTSALIVAALYFIYTLSFSSGWALGEGLGDFFDNAQVANKAMFKAALPTIVSAAFILILNSHKNKKFFLFNYVPVILTVYFLINASIMTLGYVEDLKPQYLELNEAFLTIITAINYGEISTQIFDLGVTISIVMLVQAVLMIALTIYKVIEEINRAKIKKQLEEELKLKLGVQE